MTTGPVAPVPRLPDRLRAAWAARSRREHLMLLAAAAALGWAVADGAAWRPVADERQRLVKRIAALQAEREALATQAEQYVRAQRALDLEEATWRDRLSRAEARAADLRAAVTPPAEMLARLRTLSGQGSRVTLVALSAQPGQPLDVGAAAASSPAGATLPPPGAMPARTLYRLPVEVTVEGPWTALQDYLVQVEAQAPGLRWQSLDIDAGRWPATRLTLRAVTLSEQGRWSLQ